MVELEINEVSKLVNLKPHTLRYYETIGLIKEIRRNSAGKRIYSKADLEWLEFIKRLRATGMPINKMIKYTQLRNAGDTTISERKSLLVEHLNSIDGKIKELIEFRNFVASKIDIYNRLEEKVNGDKRE